MPPRTRCRARRPLAFFVRCIDVKRNRVVPGIERGAQGGVVLQTQIATEPDDGVRHADSAAAGEAAQHKPAAATMARCQPRSLCEAFAGAPAVLQRAAAIARHALPPLRALVQLRAHGAQASLLTHAVPGTCARIPRRPSSLRSRCHTLPAAYSKLPTESCARLSKRVYSPKNLSLHEPVGPPRCLPMMISARPLSGEFSLL